MKAKDYVVIWIEKKYGGSKEIGDWTTKDIVQFAEDFAKEKINMLKMPKHKAGSVCKEKCGCLDWDKKKYCDGNCHT